MNLIIFGGRDFQDYNLLCSTLSSILSNTDYNTITVFSGNARGADALGEKWARSNNIPSPLKLFPANWKDYGKGAGHIRNQQMINAGAAHAVGYWDGKSRGTADMIERCKKHNIKLKVVNQ